MFDVKIWHCTIGFLELIGLSPTDVVLHGSYSVIYIMYNPMRLTCGGQTHGVHSQTLGSNIYCQHNIRQNKRHSN